MYLFISVCFYADNNIRLHQRVVDESLFLKSSLREFSLHKMKVALRSAACTKPKQPNQVGSLEFLWLV